MDRITKKDIERMIGWVAEAAKLPTTKEQAIEQNQQRYLEYNYNSYYGGYELVLTNVDGGGQSGAFGRNYGRMKANIFYMYLQGLYNGLTHTK